MLMGHFTRGSSHLHVSWRLELHAGSTQMASHRSLMDERRTVKPLQSIDSKCFSGRIHAWAVLVLNEFGLWLVRLWAYALR